MSDQCAQEQSSSDPDPKIYSSTLFIHQMISENEMEKYDQTTKKEVGIV